MIMTFGNKLCMWSQKTERVFLKKKPHTLNGLEKEKSNEAQEES